MEHEKQILQEIKALGGKLYRVGGCLSLGWLRKILIISLLDLSFRKSSKLFQNLGKPMKLENLLELSQ